MATKFSVSSRHPLPTLAWPELNKNIYFCINFPQNSGLVITVLKTAKWHLDTLLLKLKLMKETYFQPFSSLPALQCIWTCSLTSRSWSSCLPAPTCWLRRRSQPTLWARWWRTAVVSLACLWASIFWWYGTSSLLSLLKFNPQSKNKSFISSLPYTDYIHALKKVMGLA